jgi:NAD(P) transhydrogenase
VAGKGLNVARSIGMAPSPRPGPSGAVDPDRFDLVVIGAGPAGEKGATQAAYHGFRVAVVERAGSPGGTAVATGGIPTKALRETALQVSALRRGGADGMNPELDSGAVFERLRSRARAVSLVMCEAASRNLERHGIELIPGRGRLLPGGAVAVGEAGRSERILQADVVLLATGSRPVRPPSIPFDGVAVLDSDDVLTLDRPFSRVIIVGAGAVGCEYASIFSTIGIQVWLVEASDRLLPQLDGEIAELLETSLRGRGIDVLLGTRLLGVRRDGDEVVAELTDDRVLRADKLLFVAGRIGNTDDLGLEAVGVEVLGNRIVVDGSYRTTAKGVFAAGDVIGPPGLSSVSMEQARVAMCHAFGIPLKHAVDELAPSAIYTIPEVAWVGMTEQAADRAGLDHEAGRGWFEKNTRSVIAGDGEGLVKLVFERGGGRILGVHVLGTDAAELVHHGQALLHRGGSLSDLIDTTFNVPTRSEAYKYAAYDGLNRVDVRAAFGDVAP